MEVCPYILSCFTVVSVKKKLLSKLALRARQERWATYSFKKGIQQLADSLEESANQSREVEILKNTPCSSLEWKDGKFLVCLYFRDSFEKYFT